MQGTIWEKGEERHTYLRKIFKVVKELKDYNWLISDCEASPKIIGHFIRITQSGSYAWISGEELVGILKKDDFQWIWAVLSGFNKQYSLEEIKKYKLPYADGYKGFWKKELSIQHPLANIELVAWDGTLTLLISKEDYLVDKFRKAFPESEDLKTYNKRLWEQIESSQNGELEYQNWLENNR